MIRLLSLAVLAGFSFQDAGDAASEKAKLHEELAKAAEKVADQLLKWKSWDEARAFLDVVRAKSDARAEALDKLLAKTEKQTSGWEWDRRTSELVKEFGKERAKKFYAFARAWKEKDAEASRWTDAEGEILDDLLDYLKAYGRLCQVRSQHGLPKTRFDWKLSVPAVWHAKYIQLYPNDEAEVEGKKGYTPEGKSCESNSIANHGKALVRLLEDASQGPFDRIYVLNPGLLRIGIGQAGASTLASVIDVESGVGNLGTPTELASPPDGAIDVPLTGTDTFLNIVPGKSLKELGFPISLILFNPDSKVREVKTKLTDNNRKELSHHVSTPEKPALPDEYPNNRNAILIVANAPLKPNTTYQVTVEFSEKGEPKKRVWSFTTKR